MDAKRQKAIDLLVSGMKQKDVAAAVGVAPQTLCGWRKEPEFEAAYNSLLSDVSGAVRLWVMHLCEKAMARLDELLDHPSPQVKLDAARESLRLLPVDERKPPKIGPT